MNCPNCGRFIGNVRASPIGIDREISKVEADCKRCGTVDVTNENWWYEDFFPEGS